MLDYRFIKNDQGRLSLLVALPDAFPDHPRVFYDGGAHALFCRTPQDVHLLENIPDEIRHYLAFADRIQVNEAGQHYAASCIFAQDIPALAALKTTSPS